MSTKINLLGKIFESLTVIEQGPDKIYKKNNHRQTRWLCRCICGKEILVNSSLLIRKKYAKFSCGCKNYTKEHGNKKLRDPKIASLRALIKRYRASARNRSKKTWGLTENKAILLFNGNCFYCGSAPANTYNVYMTKEGKANTKNIAYAKTAQILFNGIDRKDSSFGYIDDNVVSCCTTCNFAKNRLSIYDFYQWIEKIALYQGFKK